MLKQTSYGYCAALSILLVASFTGICVAQLNPAFAGFTSNATMGLVNYPKVDAVGAVPPSSGVCCFSMLFLSSLTFSRPSRDRFTIEDRVISSKLVKKAISFVPMALRDPSNSDSMHLLELLPSILRSLEFSMAPWSVHLQVVHAPLIMIQIDLILDVDSSPDVDLDVWWTVSKSSPCVAEYSW
jgi:hypothetical protein